MFETHGINWTDSEFALTLSYCSLCGFQANFVGPAKHFNRVRGNGPASKFLPGAQNL